MHLLVALGYCRPTAPSSLPRRAWRSLGGDSQPANRRPTGPTRGGNAEILSQGLSQPQDRTTPSATPNIPSANLVQIGIGGWAGKKAGMAVARQRGTTVLTIGDVERLGIQRAAEAALEIASQKPRRSSSASTLTWSTRKRAGDRHP